MSIFKNDIQGNANISRNANIGSHATIGGNMTVGHNVTVKGWLDAPNIKGPLKGLYASVASLEAAYPFPEPGWFALVGNTLPASVYRVDGDKWVATGETGGTFSIYLDQLETDVTNLTDDVKDIEKILDNGLLLATTIAFTSTGTAAAMTFCVLKRDGTTTSYSKPIPIVTAEKAGMMSAADKQELSAATIAIADINTKIATLETTTSSLQTALEQEKASREAAIKNLQDQLDSLIGENASEAIDNFNEVLSFLDGLKDTDKLSSKLADLSGADEKLSADVLELQKEVWPLIVEFTATPAIIKAGQETAIAMSWNAKRKGGDVTADATITLDGESVTDKSKSVNVNLTHGQIKEFVLKVEYAGMTETRQVQVKGTHPTYFGAVSKDWTADETSILALTELIIGNRSLTRNGISIEDGKIALVYPKDFGALTSVKDGNGYEVLSSYTRSEVTVNEYPYYCYLLTVPVTASGVTQIYK